MLKYASLKSTVLNTVSRSEKNRVYAHEKHHTMEKKTLMHKPRK